MIKGIATSLILMLFGPLPAASGSDSSPALYNIQAEPELSIALFKQQGVPAEALLTVFDFLAENAGTAVTVDKKISSSSTDYVMRKISLKPQREFAAIIDFSRPSTEKRLYLLNLRTGSVEKFYVAHGRNSGQTLALKFSNRKSSKQSSLGLYLAGEPYTGVYGRSIKLHGLESSNSLAAERDIVLHPAKYASEDFLKTYGRLGLSWGCPAVEPTAAPLLITALKQGSVIYMYHPQLMEQARLTPQMQEHPESKSLQEPVRDLPGEEESLRKTR